LKARKKPLKLGTEGQVTAMAEELNDCPFCGGMAIFPDSKEPLFVVVCTKCLAHTRLCRTKEEAIEAWNGRVGEQDGS
jgi:Lar family restriction alleviation protein